MSLKALISIAVLLIPAASYASGEYDFCIDRAGPAKREVLHVRFKYGDVDPGKEIARVWVSQKYRLADSTEVEVTDFSPQHCDAPNIDEVTVNASLEQWKALGNAIGSGNPVNVAVAATDIVAGAVVSVAKGAGSFVEGVKKFFCGVFGC